MDISKIKISVGILFIVLAQAAGIIWFVAQLDASVSTLQKDTSRIETSFHNLSESTKDLSRIALFDQQILLIEDKVLANTVVLEEKLQADVIVLDAFAAKLKELSNNINAYVLVTQNKLESIEAINLALEGVTEENPLVTQESLAEVLVGVNEENPLITQESLTEALTKKAQKGKTNRLLGENSDRITIIETWMDEILEAERIAEEKKQAKKDKKDKKK